MIRRLLAITLILPMKITGYRFSKIHRMENTLTYRLIDTVFANQKAGL